MRLKANWEKDLYLDFTFKNEVARGDLAVSALIFSRYICPQKFKLHHQAELHAQTKWTSAMDVATIRKSGQLLFPVQPKYS